MHPHAEGAIRAAKNWNRWGRWTTLRFCTKRGIPMALVRLARQLEAAQDI